MRKGGALCSTTMCEPQRTDIKTGLKFPHTKKACPGKSRPLLTYEKHQVQISLFRHPPKNIFGELRKCWGLLWVYGPAFQLTSPEFRVHHYIKIFFGFKEIIDLTGRDSFQKFHAILFLDIEQGFFEFQLIAIMAIDDVRLPYFCRVEFIDRP